jgi:hypothetical protein
MGDAACRRAFPKFELYRGNLVGRATRQRRSVE